MKLPSTCFALALSLSLISTNTQSYSFDLSAKNVALAACATLAGITVSKLAYDYFFSIDDAHEFNQAVKLCEQSDELINAVDLTYSRELSILSGTNQWLTFTTQPSKYPYYNYVRSLELTITNLMRHENEIAQKKAFIFERRRQLITALTKSSPEERIGIKSSLEGYDFVIVELKEMAHALKSKRTLLQQIKQSVIVHPQYIIECQQIRIEELEHKLYAAQAYYNPSTGTWSNSPYNASTCTWNYPARQVYMNNTHITHNTHTTTNTIQSPADHTTTNNSSQADTILPTQPINSPEMPQPSAPPLDELDQNPKIKPSAPAIPHDDDVWSNMAANFNT